MARPQATEVCAAITACAAIEELELSKHGGKEEDDAPPLPCTHARYDRGLMIAFGHRATRRLLGGAQSLKTHAWLECSCLHASTCLPCIQRRKHSYTPGWLLLYPHTKLPSACVESSFTGHLHASALSKLRYSST